MQMGKILSVLEKYKLIEKETETMPSSDLQEQETAIFTTTPVTDEYAEETAVSDLENDTLDSYNSLQKFNRNMSLEEIYALNASNNYAITDTVFLLENLINALPDELPEYVKKTTLNNILVASSMNLEKLLTDGTTRYNHLNKFASDYTAQNASDITSLKQEIDKLSALISDYHQQIKHKESMVERQLSLIKLEEERLQNILTFFEK
jgi:hypothetical protein